MKRNWKTIIFNWIGLLGIVAVTDMMHKKGIVSHNISIVTQIFLVVVWSLIRFSANNPKT